MTTRSPADLIVGLPRNYLRPCLLLLLAEGTSHGYELLAQIGELSMEKVDPGGVYRCLRAMDEEGLVRSSWEPSDQGPARRIYELTPEGRDWLDVLAGTMSEIGRALAAYQERYERVVDEDGRVR